MLPLAGLTDAAEHAGYPTLALLVGLESMGIPLPGETALIAAAVLAGAGHLNIVFVIAIAAAAAIVGDNGGYVIGRLGRTAAAGPGGAVRGSASFRAGAGRPPLRRSRR